MKRPPGRLIMLAILVLGLAGLGAWTLYNLLREQARPVEALELITDDKHHVRLDVPGAQSVTIRRMDDASVKYLVRSDAAEPRAYTPDQFADMLLKGSAGRPLWKRFLNVSSAFGVIWVSVGFLGQILFTGRMVVQWWQSEKHGESLVPPSFWWMSLIGASMLLAYFIWRRDIVGVVGQATGWLIYIRNLYLIYFKAATAERAADPTRPDVQGRAKV